MFKVPEKFRITQGFMSSDANFGNNGAFVIPFEGYTLHVIASDGLGWEHVSVSMNRMPSWKQMCFIKDLFWSKEDTVVQYHPAESDYVNNHEFCLHLWRPIDQKMPVPDAFLVGNVKNNL